MPVGGLNPLASEWKPPAEQLAQLQLGGAMLGSGGGGKAPSGRVASCPIAGAIAMLSNGSAAKIAAQRAEQQAAQPQGGDEDGDLHFDELHFGEDGAAFERGASTASSAEPSPQVSVSGALGWPWWGPGRWAIASGLVKAPQGACAAERLQHTLLALASVLCLPSSGLPIHSPLRNLPRRSLSAPRRCPRPPRRRRPPQPHC